jgi:hypothetical protein
MYFLYGGFLMKKCVFFLCLCAISAIIAQSAQASGIGIYGTGGAGFMNWTYNGSSDGSTTDYFYGGGIIIDSNAAADQVFGYRFTGGYEQYKARDPQSGLTSKGINRFSMSHTFGFGIARTPIVRFWIGPRFGFHYMYGNYNTTDFTFTTMMMMFGYLFPPMRVKIDLDYFGFDLMLAMGINFNIGEYTTIFLDMGFGYMGNFNLNDSNEKGNAFGLEGKVGIMFRVNDTYTVADNNKLAI